MTTTQKRQRKETRVGTYWQKPAQITPSEARRVAESRNTYLTAAKIASDAVRAGLLRLPVKNGHVTINTRPDAVNTMRHVKRIVCTKANAFVTSDA